MHKFLILALLIVVSINIYSEDKRLYQFITDKENESFLSIEAGTYLGLSIVSKRMEFSLGYNYLSFPGYFVTTELYLLQLDLGGDLVFGTGFGGGIVFMPNIDGFSSDAYMRFPLRLRYKNFFIKAVPMPGVSMFKKKLDWKLNFFVGVGYQFDLYRKREDNTSETVTEEAADATENTTE